MDDILKIKNNLLTQDNRATRDPAFLVQVLERIGPLLPGHSDDMMFHDPVEVETYYPEDDEYKNLFELYRKGELPEHIIPGGYKGVWTTVQTCFTEEGCKEYLEADGHNLRHYHGIRIYADSFHRNREMVAVRNLLKDYPG